MCSRNFKTRITEKMVKCTVGFFTVYLLITIFIEGASKIACLLNNNASASGDFVPQTPTGAPPLDPAGGLPDPLLCAVGFSNYFRPCLAR